MISHGRTPLVKFTVGLGLIALAMTLAVAGIGATSLRADAAAGTGSITGTVTVPAGTDARWAEAVSVSLYSVETADWTMGTGLAADGSFRLDNVVPGQYKVEFWVDGYDNGSQWVPVNLVNEYNDNAASVESAPVVNVTAGATTSGVNAALDAGSTISGRLTAPTATDPDWPWYVYVTVTDTQGNYLREGQVNLDGTYSVTGVRPGHVVVGFDVYSDTLDVNLVSEYYNNSLTFDGAQALAATAGGTLTGIDAELAQGAAITGTVTAPGYTGTGWNTSVGVYAVNETHAAYDWSVGTDGKFLIAGLPAGAYDVYAVARSPLSDTAEFRPVAVGAPGTVTPNVNIALEVLTPAAVTSVAPARLADLANSTSGAAPRCVNVAGELGVPANATGVVFNVTAAGAAGPGNAVVYPDTNGNGTTVPPNASTVNFESGRDVANSAFVKLPANGDVCTAVQGAKLGRLILDVTGYVTGADGVTLMSATRVVDTRAGVYHVGPVTGPVTPGSVKTVRVAGAAVPFDAVGVIANITVTGVSGPGHLKVWAADEARPNTSVVNYAPGQDKANGQYLALSADGKIKFESVASSTNVIIDITGYVTARSPIVSTAPTRIVETRASEGKIGPIPGRLAKQQIYSVEIPTTVVPAGATSVVLNVTAVQPESLGHLRVYPDTAGNGATPPTETSSLNYIPGRDIPNMVVVQLPADRKVNFYSVSSTTDMVVDIIGYIEAPRS